MQISINAAFQLKDNSSVLISANTTTIVETLKDLDTIIELKDIKEEDKTLKGFIVVH